MENDNVLNLLRSKNGNEYVVGVEITEIYEDGQLKQGRVTVDWIVDGKWHDVDSATRDMIKINKYMIDPGNPGIYGRKLYFENIENGVFYFEDRSPDIYRVTTYRRGEHTVAYNSDDPRIVAVTFVAY